MTQSWTEYFLGSSAEASADKKLRELEGYKELKRTAGSEVKNVALNTEIRQKLADVLFATSEPDKVKRYKIYEKAFPNTNPDHLDAIRDDPVATEKYIKTQLAATQAEFTKKAIESVESLNLDREGKKQALEAAEKAAEEKAQDVVTGSENPASAKQSLENFIDKELGKAAKFIHQDFLIRNIKELKDISDGRMASLKKILVCDGSSRSPLSPFHKNPNGYPLLNFSTEKLSVLVPYIKFYKVNISNSGTSTKVEMPFPTTSLQFGVENKNFLQPSLSSNRKFFKNRDGFGIKSFSWVLSGQDEVNKFVDVAAKLVLYFQDFAQLVTEREHSGKKFKYLDFLLENDPTLREQGINYISAEIGWSVPSASSGLFTELELEAIRSNRVSLRLNLVEYNISFDESTQNSFTVEIDYRSAFEEATKKPFLSVLNPSVETCSEIASLTKEKGEIVRVQKASPSVVGGNGDSLSEIQKKLDDAYAKLREEAYVHFTDQLLEKEALFALDIPLKEIFDFSGVSDKIADAVLQSADGSQKKRWTKEVLKWKDEKAYDNNSEKIYFCFLGDILEIAMENALNPEKLKALGYGAPSIGKEIFAATTTAKILGQDYNIFSIPVDIRLFCNWFSETIIEANVKNRTIGVFISELLEKIMDNKIESSIEKFTMSRETYKSTHVTTKLSGVPLYGFHPASIVENYFKTGDDIDYIVIYSAPKDGKDLELPDTNDYSKSKTIDSRQNGIYHFVFGSTDSIIRTANFQKTEYEFERERRLAEGSDPYAILTNVFDVNINMYGNALFYPGNFVYLNPSHAIGDGGRPWKKGSVFNTMGLGGYHIVLGVTNEISDGSFTTSLKLKFVSTGENAK